MDTWGRRTTLASNSSARKRKAWPPPGLKEPVDAARRAPQQWQPRQVWQAGQWLCLIVVLAFAVQVGTVRAQAADEVQAGTLFFESEAGRIEAPRVHTDVDMKVSGVIARVEVRQRFENRSDRWVEGTYAFPLPENSAVDRLRMRVGERIIVGEVREKAEAQQLFRQAAANGQRASVVHQQRPNIFRTAVANIAPHETIEIAIGYLQIIDQQGGRYSLRFPLTITPRYIPGSERNAIDDLQPALAHAQLDKQSVSFDISVDAGVEIENVKSAYHAVRVAHDRGKYNVRLVDGAVAPDRDFELAWTPAVVGGPATALFRERTESGEHVLLMFMPPHERTTVATPREVIFIIDTSGSMSGDSIEQARDALLSGLATLTPRDRFNLIEFNSVYSTLFDTPVDASAGNIERARSFVRGLEANGGTEMLPALSAALSMPGGGEYLRQILFITDGAVSNEEALMRTITEGLGDARLFTVGIGSAPNGYFMRTAAQIGRGTFTFIGSTDQVEARMNELFRKLTHPILTAIELKWPNGVRPEYAPARVGDLYSDEPLVVSARLPSQTRGTLTITGYSSGAWTRQIALDPAEAREGVATLWARNRIADLMDLQAQRVADTDIRAQVLPLALEYQLVTKYTSLIAVDKTPVRPPSEALERARIENTKPHGQNWQASGLPKTATPAELQLLIGALALTLAFSLSRRRKVRA